MHRCRCRNAVLLLGAVVACHSGTEPARHADVQRPSLMISDAGHQGGTTHFYFLPPTVIPLAPLTLTGTFDPTVNASARVCQGTALCAPSAALAVFTNTGGTGGTLLGRLTANPTLQLYSAVWDTRQCVGGPCSLQAGQPYRVHVYATNAASTEVELGFADIQVVDLQAGQPPPTIDFSNYSPLIRNFPYVIAFRIEQGVAGALSLSPSTSRLNPGASEPITATVQDLHGQLLAGAAVSWSLTGLSDASLAPSSGQTAATGAMTTTFTAGATSGNAVVTASTSSLSATANVQVCAPAAISLTNTNVSFAATQGGANPNDVTLNVTNGGTCPLTGLNLGTISYGANQPTGWLRVGLSGPTAPTTLTFSALTGSLAPATYTATVAITADAATNSPLTVSVTFVVSAPPPTIVLTPAAITLNDHGGVSTKGQVAVSNGGSGTLDNLAVGAITYGNGQPSGWLTAVYVNGNVELAALPGNTLVPGTYTATVAVTASNAATQLLTVTFVVNSLPPTIVLTPASITLNDAGGVSTKGEVTVTNGGRGTLDNLAVGAITYGSGQPSGWLTAGLLNGNVELAALPDSRMLPGTYTATVAITASDAATQLLNVSFVLNSLPTTIVLTPSPVTITYIAGGPLSVEAPVAITNGGRGTLDNVAVALITYTPGQPDGWLGAFISPIDPGLLKLVATPGTLTSGSYTATVVVTASNAVNSPQLLNVTFVIP